MQCMCDDMPSPQTHSGSVWRVTWAHPEYGQVLATCSFDRTVCIWEEQGEVNYMYNVCINVAMLLVRASHVQYSTHLALRMHLRYRWLQSQDGSKTYNMYNTYIVHVT